MTKSVACDPKMSPPSWLVGATSNVLAKALRGGLADLRPVPRVLIDQGPHRFVYRMSSAAAVPPGAPVLLVPPLAASSSCFDLRRSCSLAEHLVGTGRQVYLVDYGDVTFSDRGLGMEHWIEEVLPRAIRTVRDDAGGRRVHLVSWCLGGILATLTLAHRPTLPVDSLTAIAAPFDFRKISLLELFRPLVELTGGYVLTPFYRLLGGAPSAVVRRVFRATGFDKEIGKPLAMLRNLDDRDFLSQIEAVDRFMERIAAYPGRTFGQIYHQFFRGNDLVDGRVDLNRKAISLADIRVPALVVAGADDVIAPRRAVEQLVGLLDNAPEVRFAVAPGGHLGVLTGRRARNTTWCYLDAFLESHDAVT